MTTNKKMLTATSTWYPTGLEVTKDTEHGSVGKRRKSLLIGTTGVPRSTLAASCACHMITLPYTTQLYWETLSSVQLITEYNYSVRQV